MNYGYVRVSSVTQKTDRQVEEMYKLGIEDKNIFIDKQSGKDFNRKSYRRLIRKLKEKDLLVIKSIDRLGRNYREIGEQWKVITQDIKADIFVIDMPILDTRDKPSNLWGRFVSDLVLQLLSFIAENERDTIRQRQAEGIKIAKEKGVKFGRPSLVITDEYYEVSTLYKNKEITVKEATTRLGISRTAFYNFLRSIETKN